MLCHNLASVEKMRADVEAEERGHTMVLRPGLVALNPDVFYTPQVCGVLGKFSHNASPLTILVSTSSSFKGSPAKATEACFGTFLREKSRLHSPEATDSHTRQSSQPPSYSELHVPEFFS